MGVLKGLVVGVVAAAALAGIGAASSCQLAIPPDQFFDPHGITMIASYPTSEAPPTLLTGAGTYLFYSQGSALYRLAKTGRSSPDIVQTFQASTEVTAIVFDGANTVAFCAGGVIGGFDPVTLAKAPFVGLPAGCDRMAMTETRIAYSASFDGGVESIVTATRTDGGDRVHVPPADADSGIEATRTTLIFLGDVVYADTLGTLAISADGMRCGLALVGLPENPKAIAFDAGDLDGGPTTSIVLRGAGDVLRRVDLLDPPPCCPTGAEATKASAQCHGYNLGLEVSAPEGSDFAIQGAFFYWSSNGQIKRMPSGQLRSAVTPEPELVVDIPAGAPIPSMVVDDTNVYFILGNTILRAPLPQPG